MEALMFLAILVPVAAFVWAVSRPVVDDGEPPTLDVQNHIGDVMGADEFDRRWRRITGPRSW